MDELKKLFQKQRPVIARVRDSAGSCSDIFAPIEGSKLKSLPVAQLCNIILRYNNEVLSLTQLVQIKEESLAESQSALLEKEEKLSQCADFNQLLEEKLEALDVDYRELLDKVENFSSQIEIHTAQLAEKDKLLESHKRRIGIADRQISELNKIAHYGDEFDSTEKLELLKIKADVFSKNTDSETVKELVHLNQLFKNDITTLSLKNSRLSTESLQLKGKLLTLTQEKQSLENSITRLTAETEHLKQGFSQLKFQKESMKYEIRSLCQSLAQKEEQVKAKRLKLQAKKELIHFQGQELVKLQAKLDTAAKDHYLNLVLLRKTSEEHRTGLLAQVADLQSQLSSQKYYSEGQLHETIEALGQNNEILKMQLEQVHLNNEKLLKKLTYLERRRSNAKNEVLELSKKLRIVSSECSTPRSFPQPEAAHRGAFVFAKTEVEKAYKSLLLELRHSANNDQDCYKVPVQNIAAIEKRLNSVLMFLHEKIEGLDEKHDFNEELNTPRVRKPNRIYSYADEKPSLFRRNTQEIKVHMITGH